MQKILKDFKRLKKTTKNFTGLERLQKILKDYKRMTKTAKDIYLSYLEQLNLFKNWAIQTISSKPENNNNKKRYLEGCACAGAALKT